MRRPIIRKTLAAIGVQVVLFSLLSGFTVASADTTPIEQYVDQIFGLPVLIYQVPSKPSVLYVKIVNRIFAKFMKTMCPGITYTKTLHKDLKICDTYTKIGIIDGWITGDGWKRRIGISVCENLIKDMFDLCLSVGINGTINTRKAYKRSKKSYNFVRQFRLRHGRIAA